SLEPQFTYLIKCVGVIVAVWVAIKLGLEPQIVADSLLGLLYFLFERFVIQRRMTIMAMTMRLYLPPAPLHFLELSPGERPIVGRVHRTMRQTPIGPFANRSSSQK